jgi:hypothetical protein
LIIDGLKEFFNTIYIAKKLYDMGKYGLVKLSFCDIWDFDMYYQDMYDLIDNLFEYHSCQYYENKYFELHVLSDPVIVDFFVLAGKYGKRNDIPEDDNPYIKEAKQEVSDNLGFSYSLDYRLMFYTEPNRPYHSRIGVILYEGDYIDIGFLANRLLDIYEWFEDKCEELRIIKDQFKPLSGQIRLDGFITEYEEAMAA